MPLHAEAEAARRILDRLDDAVRRRRGDDEPFAERLHGLVMAAVDLLRVAREQLLQPRPLLDPHIVRHRMGGVVTR